MYEIHGWIVLRESTVDVDVGGFADVVTAIRALVDQFDDNPSVNLLTPNGMTTPTVTVAHPPETRQEFESRRPLSLNSAGTFSQRLLPLCGPVNRPSLRDAEHGPWT